MLSEWVRDRTFIRSLAREIIADRAPHELDAFDTLADRFFASPPPESTFAGAGLSIRSAAASKPAMTEVVLIALIAVLHYLVTELEETPQRPLRDGVRVGLTRLLQRGAGDSGACMRLRAPERGLPERLVIIAYSYAQPVGVTVPTYALHMIVQSVGEISGLNEEQCIDLSMAVLTQVCRNITAG
jgi:hypothetical protein